MKMGTRGPQNRGSPFLHDTGSSEDSSAREVEGVEFEYSSIVVAGRSLPSPRTTEVGLLVL